MVVDSEVIGEVIEASTTEFTAESRELHLPPHFGSFVKVKLSASDKLPPAPPPPEPSDSEDPFEAFRGAEGSYGKKLAEAFGEGTAEAPGFTPEPAIYGVVSQASTTPVDTSRRMRAYWKDEEELKAEQPELAEWMLVTSFQAIIIGYTSDGSICRFLPPQPPKLLAGVFPCSVDEIRAITSEMSFLRTLANARNAPLEEVVAACIREADRARGGNFDFLVNAGKELAVLLKDDYDRLQAIMRRVAP